MTVKPKRGSTFKDKDLMENNEKQKANRSSLLFFYGSIYKQEILMMFNYVFTDNTIVMFYHVIIMIFCNTILTANKVFAYNGIELFFLKCGLPILGTKVG